MKKSSLVLSLILFLSFKSFACYESSIMSPNPFMGNNEEIFKLSDGSLWKVMYEYEYLYEYYPDVVICPSKNILIIDGKSLNVMPLSTGPSYGSSNYFESQIEGESEGWSGDTIYLLTNGQVWQQTEYYYTYHYAYRPDVIIYKDSMSGYKMQIEGIDKAVGVTRLK